jgi:hypothetical protein
VHDQIEGDACDIAVVPAGAKEAVTNTSFTTITATHHC